MTNTWYNSHHQQDIPSTSENPSTVVPALITAEPNVGNTIPGCPCPVCSRARYNYQTGQPTTEYQDPCAPVESTVPYANQNANGGYPYGIVSGQPQVWPVASQAPLQQNQETVRAVTPSTFEIQAGAAPNQAQVLDMSAPERLRRLAERYINNPLSFVNGVNSVPGPGGRFQVIITVEIGDILGDTVN